MEDWEDGRFEELDDQITNNLHNLPLNKEDEEEEEEEGHSFNKFYGPIRAAFSSDSKLLEDFTSCQNHKERLKILLNIEVGQHQHHTISEYLDNWKFNLRS